MSSSRRLASVVGTLLLLAPAAAKAQQTIVYPETAGQNQVRWDKFDWQYVDLLADKDKKEGAGLRLYYYKDEKDTAERAAAAVVEEYRWLVQEFDYKPQIQIPYILYNSHGELEQTNIFQIGESTLGVTSPEDLRMTTAYWGDHARFRHVSLHEMVHQFTIQKVNSVAEQAKAYGSPLQKFPLWFVEGLAEYYSTPGGIDSETEEYVRDLVANPDPFRGYVLPPFLSDERRDFIYTYKLGQMRCYFLAETYGKDKLQEILGTSYRLRGWRRSLAGPGTPTTDSANDPPSMRHDRVLEFDELLERVTGDPAEKMQAKWEDWLKHRYYKQYLAATQSFSEYKEVRAAKRYPDSFVVSPDGNAMIYRGVEPVTGKTGLWLIDPRDPSGSHTVVSDNRPGVTTLHYFDRPVAAIDETEIAYVARDGRNDVLRILPYKHSARDAEENNRVHTRARFRLGRVRRTYNPAKEKIRELGSPTFSPDRKTIAVVGLDEDGISDIWTLELASGTWTRITHDDYAEKEIDWGPAGIVYSADATETRTDNLFLLDPATGNSQRITRAEANHRYPKFTSDGKAIAFAGDDDGKWDLYLLQVNDAKGKGQPMPPEPPHDTTDPGTTSLESAKQAVATATPDSLLAEAGLSDAGTVLAAAGTPAAASTATPDPTPSASATPKAAGDAAKDTAVAASATAAKSMGPLTKVSDFPTGLTYPAFTDTKAFALGFKSGRYRIFSIDRSALASTPLAYAPGGAYTPWAIPTRELDNPRAYSIWRGDSWQLEQAFATLGGSTGIYGGGFVYFDDKMRDKTVYVTAQAYGRGDLTDAQAVYLDRSRRVPWGIAAYLSPQPVIDPIFSDNTRTILFLEQKFGAAGILEFPLNRYFRLGGSLGLAGTRRFIPSFWNDPAFGLGFGDDITGRTQWEKENDGIAPEIDTSVSLGFDTLTLNYETGPLDGNSVLATVSTYYQPTRNSWFGQYQIDAEHYTRVYKTANIGFRVAWGESFGDEWKRPFYVSSVDNLRGVPYFSYDYLIQNKYLVGNAELKIPLNGLVRLLIFQNIEGIAAVDAGTVFNDYNQADANKTAAFVTGFNFNLAIFQFRLHFAKPFDIGGIKPGQAWPQDGQVVVPNGWVTNFTIRYLFF